MYMCISLAQEVENWWALDGEKCFKALKVMEDSHTTSTSLGEKLLYIALSVPTTVLVCYEVGTQWDIFLFEIQTRGWEPSPTHWCQSLDPCISFIGGLLHVHT